MDLLRGVLHVRQTVKREYADAATTTQDPFGREVGPPKNGKTRTIVLPKHLRDSLQAHLSAEPPLTPGGTGPDSLVFGTPQGQPARALA